MTNLLHDIIKTILTTQDMHEKRKALQQHACKIDEIANLFVEVLAWSRIADTPDIIMTLQDTAGRLYSVWYTCNNTAKYHSDAQANDDVAQKILSFLNSDFT